jgi:hypothetical protein
MFFVASLLCFYLIIVNYFTHYLPNQDESAAINAASVMPLMESQFYCMFLYRDVRLAFCCLCIQYKSMCFQ